MKGYFLQLWNDPAFFANSIKSLVATVGAGAAAFFITPVGRTMTEKLVLAALAAVGVGTAALPSAKKE